MDYDLDALLDDQQPQRKRFGRLSLRAKPPLFTTKVCEPYEFHRYTKDVTGEDGTVTTIEPQEVWMDKNGHPHIDYPTFVENFARANNLVCCNGLFYTPDGCLSETQVRKDVTYSLIDRGWNDRLDVQTASLFRSLKDMKSVDELDLDGSVIPFQNGDLHLDGQAWTFHLYERCQMPYRMGVDLLPGDKPMPKFEKWLHDLFDPEDIDTVQEMLGYAMIPSTAVQEAFFLVGDAAAGKSVLGHILGRIINNGFQAINTQDLVTQRFSVADAENKLVLYDDDLGSAALTETGILKKLITADQPIPAERKYEKGFTFQPYAKVIACTNIMLSSLYDDTNGFFRRLHPIHVLPRPSDRKNIPGFGQQIADEESEAIVRWALRGLKRLMENDMQITWSRRSKEYMGTVLEKAVHYPDFIKETLEMAPGDEDVSSAELRKLYERWCRENNIQDTKVKRMQSWLIDNADKYGMEASRWVIRNGRQVRGYKGVKIKDAWRNSSISI